MRRPLIALAAGVALTVPAAVGLLTNASFAQRPPLTSPTSASTTTHPTPSATDDSSMPDALTHRHRRRPRR